MPNCSLLPVGIFFTVPVGETLAVVDGMNTVVEELEAELMWAFAVYEAGLLAKAVTPTRAPTVAAAEAIITKAAFSCCLNCLPSFL